MKKRWKTIIFILALIVLCAIFVLCLIPITAYFLPANCLPNYSGKIEIADVGIEVSLIELPTDGEVTIVDTKLMNLYRQFIVDKENCAAEFYQYYSGVVFNNITGSWVIGDHSSQEFAPLKNCKEGMEVIITRPDGSINKYYVTKVFIGYNIDGDLIDQEGASLLNDNPGGIILYTCADDTAVPVHIVFLHPTISSPATENND